jgi:hypothetical protein
VGGGAAQMTACSARSRGEGHRPVFARLSRSASVTSCSVAHLLVSRHHRLAWVFVLPVPTFASMTACREKVFILTSLQIEFKKWFFFKKKELRSEFKKNMIEFKKCFFKNQEANSKKIQILL